MRLDDEVVGIPVTVLRPSVMLSASSGRRTSGGIMSVICPKCLEKSTQVWQEEYKRLKCDTCGHEWTPPEKEGGTPGKIPDEAPVVFCPVFGCGERMKSIVYEELSLAHREARYICICGSSITLTFALYED